MLIQYGHIDTPLSEYAAKEPENKFTISLGPISQGVVMGALHTLPSSPWDVGEFGKWQVHFFYPFTGNEAVKLPSDDLAKFVVYAPTTIKLNDLLKSKDEQLHDKDKKMSELMAKNSALSTEVDALRQSVSGFKTTGEPVKTEPIRKFSMLDLVVIFLPTLIGYYLSGYANIEPIIGTLTGLFIGTYLLYRRWG
jgi:hypothetical protein